MNRSRPQLSVIIPAYNEELRLPGTLSQSIQYLHSQPYDSEIIVVNDGSSDGTERIVEARSTNSSTNSIPLKLLRHPDNANHGKGATVRRGMLAARGMYRLFMDADNSTTIAHIEKFWPFFDQGYDVVIGSRAMPDSVIGVHQNRLKEIAGRVGNRIIRNLAVPGILDTQAGFKMMTDRAAETIFPRLTIDRWGYDIEMLAVARLHGLRICEVPITWFNSGGSKVSTKAYLEVLSEVWTIRSNMRRGVYR